MIDLVRLLAAKRVPFLNGGGHHHARGGWLQLHCPLCAGGRAGWHLGFSLNRGVFSCYRCGALRFENVLSLVLRSDPHETKRLIAEFQSDAVARKPPPVTRQRVLAPPPCTTGLQPQHRKYLEGRRFDPDALVTAWGLRATCHKSASWSWRVIIPIRNGDDKIIAYQGRAIGGADPKYKMTDDEDCLEAPDSMLYGIDKVPGDSVIVVEGVPGVWRLGFGTVGTFGIDWKTAQANRLRRFKNRYILFDPEPKAQQRARGLAEQLSLFGGNTEILTGFDTDPGDFGRLKAKRIRRALGFANQE